MNSTPKMIITGGSRGIGRGIVQAFAKAGYDVAFSYKSCEKEAQELVEFVKNVYGRECFCFQASLEEHGAVEKFINEAYEALGGLDVYINNAGLSIVDSIFDMPDETVDLILNLTLRSYLMGAREAGRIMVRNKTRGNIINISSVRGENTWPNDIVYGATKAGVNRAARAFALNLAPYGIRVNTIAPGNTAVRTEEEWRAEGADEDYIKNWISSGNNIPLGRRGNPNDIAEAILFLVSEKASYITGTLLTIDGGLTIASMPEQEQKDEPGYHRWGYTPEIH